jgi:hypothetical protein
MVTYQRDLAVMRWCQKEKISFEEKHQQGVFRGMKNRVEMVEKMGCFDEPTH